VVSSPRTRITCASPTPARSAARSIVGDNAGPAEHERAVIIAESEIPLRKVGAAAVAAFKRHRGAGLTETKTPSDSADRDQSSTETILSDGAFAGRIVNALIVRGITLMQPNLRCPELIKLERYERRAKLRRCRAIGRLMELRAPA
jgi:hypothetical protein